MDSLEGIPTKPIARSKMPRANARGVRPSHALAELVLFKKFRHVSPLWRLHFLDVTIAL
jgi:hypothetical protein